MKIKKVMVLIPNFGFGGAQKVMADHSKLLGGNVELLEVVFNDWEEKRLYESPNAYESLEVAGGGIMGARFRNFILRIRRLRKLKKKFKPDVTISHLEGADYVNLFSGGRDKKVIVIHGSKVGDLNIRGWVGKLRHHVLIPWLYKKADRILTVSKGIKEELQHDYRLPPEKIQALPNFFDCAAIAQKAAQPVDAKWDPIFRQSSFKLITFGRLAKQKNMQALFPIFKELRRQGLNVQLYILGDGELREELLSGARDVSDKVWTVWDDTAPTPDAEIYFLGYQSAPHPFLKHADLYLMTSLWEGFPMALCEAMASGVAVAAADCPTGPNEILDVALRTVSTTANGVLLPMPVPDADPSVLVAWSDAILQLSNEPKTCIALRENALRRVKNYDESVVGPKWLSAYLDW